MPDITFVAVKAPLKGKRAAVVAHWISMLVEANGELVTWDEMIEGVEHPHQYMPALMALELVGVVRRWEYSEPGHKGKKTSWTLTDDISVIDSEVRDVD